MQITPQQNLPLDYAQRGGDYARRSGDFAPPVEARRLPIGRATLVFFAGIAISGPLLDVWVIQLANLPRMLFQTLEISFFQAGWGLIVVFPCLVIMREFSRKTGRPPWIYCAFLGAVYGCLPAAILLLASYAIRARHGLLFSDDAMATMVFFFAIFLLPGVFAALIVWGAGSGDASVAPQPTDDSDE